MLMMLAALAVQSSPALDADPYRAAIMCRNAIAVTGFAADGYGTTAKAAYYTIAAIEALPASTAVFERMSAVNGDNGDTDAVMRAGPENVMRECDRRYPLARRPGPVRLPADALERDVMCAASLTILSGIAEAIRDRTGDASYYQRLMPQVTSYQARAEASLRARGMNTEDDLRRTAGEQLLATLRIGNLQVIEQACLAANPLR